MFALKALVVIMGILLLAGTAVIAVTLMHRVAAGKTLVGSAPAPVDLPSLAQVSLPAGTHVVGVSTLGERLAVHVSGPDGDSVLLVEPASGAISETLQFKQATP